VRPLVLQLQSAVSAGLRKPRAFNESTSAVVLFKDLQVAQALHPQ
jgi:hypothetical protein